MGRIDNVVLASIDTIQLTEQNNQTFEFDKKKDYGTSDKLNAAILDNIKSLISNYYIHDNWTPVWSDYYVFTNSSKLNFDLNNVDENNVPKCITTSFSNYSGFSGFTREDGVKVSDKNVLDGSSFSISINFGEDKNISAHGYMMYPSGYREKTDSIKLWFFEIDKDKPKDTK